MTVLRASSLAAVTILVWSTMPNPRSCEILRTFCRASTMSCSERTGTTSLLVMVIDPVCAPEPGAKPLHPPLNRQRGVDTREAQAELDQRNGDRRAHAHDDSLGVEYARHRGDVRDHPPDVGIDELER